MKLFATLAVLVTSAALAAEPTGFQIKVTGVPADAVEVIALIDTPPVPPPSYDDPPPAPIVPPPAAPAIDVAGVAAPGDASAPAAGQPPRRRRGGGRGNSAPPPPAVRVATATNGTSTVTLNATTVASDKYQIRVIALRGGDTMPVVLAGGRVAAAKVEAEQTTAVDIALAAPRLKVASINPASVVPGATYTLAGTITDAANSLGAKGRMRVWMSHGAPPRANYAGAQISTIDVKTEGNDVSFSFALNAPKEPTTLYFQFGELPTDFARADGTQAPVLVLPDLSAGAAPLSLRVEPAKVAAQ